MAITKSNVTALSKLDGPAEQKREILKVLGDLKQYELLDDECLLATYVESNVLSEVRRADGEIVKLYGTENRATESRYQSKAFLLVKSGPTAFRYHNNGQAYEGIVPTVGDWVVIHSADGRELFLGDTKADTGVSCRRIKWDRIFMRVADPRAVH